MICNGWRLIFGPTQDTSASEAALRRAQADDAEVASLVRRLRQHRQRNHFAQRIDRLYRETPGRSA